MFILGALLGGAIGAVIAWLLVDRRLRGSFGAMKSDVAIAQARERDAQSEARESTKLVDHLRKDVASLQQDRAALGAQLEAEKKNLTEQREQLAEARTRLKEAFADLSVEALQKNSQQFFALAEQTFKTLQTEASGTLEQKKAEIASVLQPMHQTLEQYREKIDQIEKARGEAYRDISQQLVAVATTQQNLSRETTQLVQALRKPQGRGRWGELTLKRLFELAGMVEHVTFEEQVTTDDGRLRPDCIVNLPEDRQVIIDSKCVIDAFLDGTAAENENQRRQCFARHAVQVRSRVTDLSSKAYWEQFKKATDYVVLFLPGEAFLYAAVEQEPTLIEDALNQRVIIASPTTLLGLLRVIEHAWRQQHIEANAVEIRDLAGSLYKRIHGMARHFQKLGVAIGKANEAYNDTVGSLERKVLPAARKMAQMGVDDKGNTLEEPAEVLAHPRELSKKSWNLFSDLSGK